MGLLLTEATFKERFPEFGEQQLAVVDTTINKAERDVPANVWGNEDIRRDAVAYLTAHLLALRVMQIGMQVGAPSGQSLGAGLDSTLYGQEYKQMRDCLPVCGFALYSEPYSFTESSSGSTDGGTDPVSPVQPGAEFIYTQSAPSTTWTINHNLGFRPAVELLNAGGQEIEGDIAHTSVNQVVVTLNPATAGQARLN